MGIRDEEIARIVKYAQGLGIVVIWKIHKKGDNTGASWATDGSEITMYTYPNKPKTQIILDFVHELAHHMAWLADGRTVTKKVNDAFGAMDDESLAPKAKRRLVYESEKADSFYRYKVWDELGIKIPLWKLEVDRQIDVWLYKHYWRTGADPIRGQLRKKRKELLKKLKPSK